MSRRFALAVSLFHEVRFIWGFGRVRAFGVALEGFLFPRRFD